MNQQNKTERWEETIKDTRKKQLELEIHALANCNRPDIIEDGIHTLLSDARREERENLERNIEFWFSTYDKGRTEGNGLTIMTKVNREWELSIQKIVDKTFSRDINNLYLDVPLLTSEVVKLLSQTRNNLLREIMEEMPKKGNVEYYKLHEQERYIMRIQNQLIDQVNTILESKLSTVKK